MKRPYSTVAFDSSSRRWSLLQPGREPAWYEDPAELHAVLIARGLSIDLSIAILRVVRTGREVRVPLEQAPTPLCRSAR